MLIRTSFVLATIMLMSGFARGDGDIAAGRLRFSICGACHGMQGQGNRELAAPRIAGLPSWYTSRQLRSFSKGTRGGPASDRTSKQMAVFAANLSAVDIDNLAAYLESLPPPDIAPVASLPQDLQEAGEAAFQQCAACHGPNGEGIENLGAPPLRHQEAWYLKKQLGDFKTGVRGYDAGDTFAASMRAIAQTIDTEETADVIVSYLHATRR